MGEFSDNDDYDDADFANFDLNAAVHAARNNNSNPPFSSDITKTAAASAAAGNTFTLKHAPSSNEDNYCHPKRPKLMMTNNEQEDVDSDVVPPPFDSSDINDANSIAIPEKFKDAMTNAMQMHFGHSMFRPGQLTVLYSLLGDEHQHKQQQQHGGGSSSSSSSNGGRDTCVFWATGWVWPDEMKVFHNSATITLYSDV